MKKTNSPIFRRITLGSLAGILALILAASCSLGLEPARSDAGSGTLSLSLATLPGYSPSETRTESPGRAVVQGGGYLYVRPLGGPGGTGAKRYYGPYRIQATSSGYDLFKTTDIPGGSYDGLAVLFAAAPVDSVAVTLPSGATTLGAVLSLPDADFRAAVTAELTDGLTALDVSLDDSASFAITGATTIRPNATTNLSVTLVPATNKVLYAIEGGGVYYERSETHRAFIRVTDLKALFGSMSPETSSLAITARNPLAQSVTLSAFAAYRADGSLIPGSSATNVTLASGQTARSTAAWDGSDIGYLYAEFTGTALNFSFEAIVPESVRASVSVLDGTIGGGMTASIYVLPRVLLASDFSPIIDPDIVCGRISVAYYQGTTTGNTVSGPLVASDGSGPWIPSESVTGYVYAVVDGILWLGTGATDTSLTPLGQGTFSAGSAPEFSATTPARHDSVLFTNRLDEAYLCETGGDYAYSSTFNDPASNDLYFFSTSVDWTGVWNLADPRTHPGCVGYGKVTSVDKWSGKILKSYSGDVYVLVSGTYNGNVIRYRSAETLSTLEELYVDMNNNQWVPLFYYLHVINISTVGHLRVTVINQEDNSDYAIGSGTIADSEGLFPLYYQGGSTPYIFPAADYDYSFINDSNVVTNSGSSYPGSMPTAFIVLDLDS